MNNLLRVIVGLAIFGLVACQTMPYKPYAREVKRKPGAGGQIALKLEHRDEDRVRAQELMQSNCSATAVKVLEEGEVAVGTTTSSNAKETRDAGTAPSKVGSLFGIPLTSGGADPSKNTQATATTTEIKEWNISYECEKAVADSTKPAKSKKSKNQ